MAGVYLFNFYECFHQKEPRTMWTTFMTRGGTFPLHIALSERTFLVTRRECAEPTTDGRQLPMALGKESCVVVDGGSGPAKNGAVCLRFAFAEAVEDNVLSSVALNGALPRSVRSVPPEGWIAGTEPTRAKCSCELGYSSMAAKVGENRATIRQVAGRGNLLIAGELWFGATVP